MSVGDTIIDVLSWISLLGGSAFLLIGAFGIVRFPDFWSRLHAASVLDSAGMALILLGLILQGGITLVTAKLILIGVFLIITGPTATHAVANAAWISGSRPPGDRSSPPVTPEDLAEAVATAPEHDEVPSSTP